jgi:hypothetical protein
MRRILRFPHNSLLQTITTSSPAPDSEQVADFARVCADQNIFDMNGMIIPGF